jgi:hypothetical protein
MPGHDELAVGHAVDVLDAPAQREPEDEDEEERGDHRRRDRLDPQLQHAVDLARRERPQAAAAHQRLGEAPRRDLAAEREIAHEAIALT